MAGLAVSAGLDLVQPERIGEVANLIEAHDALIVAAYGQILRPDTLYAAEKGAWNVHASLLPAYRGAAPIERAIMNGEEETGVSIMRMDEGLDTGSVALQKKVRIHPDANAGELMEAIVAAGTEAIVETLDLVERNAVALKAQDESRATYAPKLTAEDRVIRWDGSAKEIHDQVRALAPIPGARTFHPEYDGPVKILRSRVVDGQGRLDHGEARSGHIFSAKERILVQCGEGVLQVYELQAPGGRPVEAGEFLRGNKVGGAFTDP